MSFMKDTWYTNHWHTKLALSTIKDSFFKNFDQRWVNVFRGVVAIEMLYFCALP
jgi:hypothetical protein